MLNIFKKYIEKYFNSHVLRTFVYFSLIFILCGCEDQDAIIEGRDDNFKLQSACWQGSIVDIVLRGLNGTYTAAVKGVSGVDGSSGASVIAVGFSIWMALKLLRILSSFKEENLGEMWTEIIQKLFVCGFCATIVVNGDLINWAFATFCMPLYNAILELGTNILSQNHGKPGLSMGDLGELNFNTNYAACKVAVLKSASTVSTDISDMSKCLICQISDRLNSGIKIGLALFEYGLKGFLTGIFVMLIFFVAKLFFVLFIVDSLFRLYFAMFLFPVGIVACAFNSTRKWGRETLIMFLNSSGIMLFLGLLISVSVSTLEALLIALNDPQNGEGFTDAGLSGQGPIFLSVLLIAVLMINIPGLGVVLADKFIGGGRGLEFQETVTNFAADSAKRFGAAMLNTVTAGTTTAATAVAEHYELTRRWLNRIKQIRQKDEDVSGG